MYVHVRTFTCTCKCMHANSACTCVSACTWTVHVVHVCMHVLCMYTIQRLLLVGGLIWQIVILSSGLVDFNLEESPNQTV